MPSCRPHAQSGCVCMLSLTYQTVFVFKPNWVLSPAAALQLCFDFIESAADGRLYCIECNPRTSSIITEFHDNPDLATGELRGRQPHGF